jgi:hypothetical protein
MKTPREVLDEFRQDAYSQHNLSYEPSAPESASSAMSSAWTIPMRISVVDGSGMGSKVVSEIIRIKLGDPAFSSKGVAARIRRDLGLSLDADKIIESQINERLKLFGRQQGPGGGDQKLIRLSVHARKGDYVFVDECNWDLSEPLNTAVSYSASVCSDLGLDGEWFDTISQYVQSRLDEVNEDLRARPHIVDILPPLTQVLREEPLPADYPRIEPYDASKDGEAERQKARMRALKAKPLTSTAR